MEFPKELATFILEVLLVLGIWYAAGILSFLVGDMIFGVPNRWRRENLKNALVVAMLGPIVAGLIVVVLNQRANRKTKSTASGPA